MSRDNVKRVLVTSGNQAVLAAGGKVDDLAIGQIGVFDEATHLAIGATSTPKNFYLAVGVGSSEFGVDKDVKFSSGQYIQSDHLRSYEFRPHTAGRPQIVTISGLTAPAVGDEFAVRVEFLNARIARRMGRVQFSHTYAVVAQTAVIADLAQQIADSINANPDGFLSAAVSGNNVVLTTGSLNPNGVKNLNLGYYNLLETNIIVSLVEGFGPAAIATTTQDLVYEEGDGGQIRQLEFHENGLADPYVLSDVTGTARELNFYAVAGKYDQFTIEYGHFTQSGWLEYLNDIQTTIAVPATDTVTRNALVDVLDAQFEAKGFDGKSEVAKSSSVDPTVVEPSNDDDTQIV